MHVAIHAPIAFKASGRDIPTLSNATRGPPTSEMLSCAPLEAHVKGGVPIPNNSAGARVANVGPYLLLRSVTHSRYIAALTQVCRRVCAQWR